MHNQKGSSQIKHTELYYSKPDCIDSGLWAMMPLDECITDTARTQILHKSEAYDML